MDVCNFFQILLHFLDTGVPECDISRTEHYIEITVKIPFNLTPHMGMLKFCQNFDPSHFRHKPIFGGNHSKKQQGAIGYMYGCACHVIRKSVNAFRSYRETHPKTDKELDKSQLVELKLRTRFVRSTKFPG